jgi:hypothetical protein
MYTLFINKQNLNLKLNKMSFYSEFNIIQISRKSQLGMITITFKYQNTNI